MCGIVGIHALHGSAPIDSSVVEAMNLSIRHRGPDSDGIYEDPGRTTLAMRRLAIIDVAGGQQPIANEDASVWVVMNGEIYNHAELRRDLEARGHVFKTRSDTEVVVHAYEEFGEDCPTKLRGMFAFAIWDTKRQRLFVARDRVGIKQLFYAVVGDQLVFGSEIKALLQHPALERRLRPSAVNHYLTYLYVPEPMTMFEGIHELRAGHVLSAERGELQTRRYWDLRYEVDDSLDIDQAAEGLRAQLEEAVQVRLMSEVPLGGFLSGGIDSGSIVALMAKHSATSVKTFSIGYDTGGEAFDERVYARELASFYGTEHHEFGMSPDVVDLVPRLVRAFDQPCADSTAIPTWYLCEYTRRHVTVALSGLGGDEVAAGYERYRGAVLGERLQWVPSWVTRSLLRPLVDRLPDPRNASPWSQRAKRFVRAIEEPFDERYFGLLCQVARGVREDLLSPEMNEQIDLDEPMDHFKSCLHEVSGADPLNRALFADLKLYLPGDLLTLTDRMSMAHSLEARVPFLDHHLLEYAARIPPDFKLRRMELKHILRRAVKDLLPESFFQRRKMGFSAPLAVWFRNELRPFVEDTLSRERIEGAGVFRYQSIRRLLDDHFARRANYDNQIWALIAFSQWQQEYLGGGGFDRGGTPS